MLEPVGKLVAMMVEASKVGVTEAMLGKAGRLVLAGERASIPLSFRHVNERLRSTVGLNLISLSSILCTRIGLV
jgi:hypothetical protein